MSNDSTALQTVQPVVQQSLTTLGGTDVQRVTVRSWLNAQQLQQAQALAAKFNPRQSTVAISAFGSDSLTEIADVTKPILDVVRARDVGPAQETMNQFTKELLGIDFNLAYQTPNVFKRWISFLNPLIAFLNSLKTVERLMDDFEKKLNGTSDRLIERMTSLDQMKGKVKQAVPKLALYAAAAEYALEREEARLEDLQKNLQAAAADPALVQQVNEQRTTVMRLRVRIFNLRESYMKSWLMIPVIEEATKAAQIVNDEVMAAVQQAMPDLRLMLAVMIAQYDTASAADTVMQTQAARRALTEKLAGQLGATSQKIEAMLTDKRNNVESLKKLRDSLVAQMRRGIELDQKLAEQFEQAYQAFDEITESVKSAVSSVESAPAT